MQGMGETEGEACPFEFNFDPATFKAGDTVSYRVTGSLSERQRTVFLLRFVEDMQILEIAEATGMKEGTVKGHLFRALEAVRERLGRFA